jgi:hypothetical protein
MTGEKWILSIKRLLLWFAMTSFLTFLCSCATTMKVIPQVKQTDSADFRLKGKVIYEGNKEYLPRVLIDEPVTIPKIEFRYAYDVFYGKRDVPDVLALYNPLTIVGFPTGENTVTVTGRLDILKGEEVIKSYGSTCILEKTRNLFSEGTFTEMRRKGIMAVRDNIESQICSDKGNLERLLAPE